MKLKINNNFKDFVSKHTKFFLITGIILCLLGVLLLPINPSDYLFPLSGVFQNNSHVLLGIIALVYLGLKAIRYKKYLDYPTKLVPIVTISGFSLVLVLTIIAFINITRIGYITAILAYMVCLMTLIEMKFYEKKKTDSEQLVDLVLIVLFTYIAGVMLHSVDKTVGNMLMLVCSIILIACSIFIFSILYILKREKNYLHKSDLPEKDDDVDTGIREIQDKLKNNIVTIIDDRKEQ